MDNQPTTWAKVFGVAEITHSIIRELTDKQRDLLNLRLVSQPFNTFLLPHFFGSIHLDLSQEEFCSSYRLVETMLTGAATLQAVREVSVNYGTITYPEEISIRNALLTTLFRNTPNLCKIRCDGQNDAPSDIISIFKEHANPVSFDIRYTVGLGSQPHWPASLGQHGLVLSDLKIDSFEKAMIPKSDLDQLTTNTYKALFELLSIHRCHLEEIHWRPKFWLRDSRLKSFRSDFKSLTFPKLQSLKIDGAEADFFFYYPPRATHPYADSRLGGSRYPVLENLCLTDFSGVDHVLRDLPGEGLRLKHFEICISSRGFDYLALAQYLRSTNGLRSLKLIDWNYYRDSGYPGAILNVMDAVLYHDSLLSLTVLLVDDASNHQGPGSAWEKLAQICEQLPNLEHLAFHHFQHKTLDFLSELGNTRIRTLDIYFNIHTHLHPSSSYDPRGGNSDFGIYASAFLNRISTMVTSVKTIAFHGHFSGGTFHKLFGGLHSGLFSLEYPAIGDTPLETFTRIASKHKMSRQDHITEAYEKQIRRWSRVLGWSPIFLTSEAERINQRQQTKSNLLAQYYSFLGSITCE